LKKPASPQSALYWLWRRSLACKSLLEATVTVTDVVYLHPVGSPNVVSGVLKLTTADSAGAYNSVAVTTIHNSGTFIYEVLYADPLSIQSAKVPVTVTGMHVALAYASFAPFYNGREPDTGGRSAVHFGGNHHVDAVMRSRNGKVGQVPDLPS
jgi:hypothetical protein